MPRRWQIAAVIMLVSAPAAQPRCSAAIQYGQPINAVPVATPPAVNASAPHNTRPQPEPELRPSHDRTRRRTLRQTEPQESTAKSGSLRERISSITGGKPISDVFGGLAIVLGAFFLLAWIFRRGMPKGAGRLPGEVVEVLGNANLQGKQNVQLVRLGNKLLLISLTPSGAETLAEVTEPSEVARILGLCESTKQGSASVAFRRVFDDLAKEQPKG